MIFEGEMYDMMKTTSFIRQELRRTAATEHLLTACARDLTFVA
jgi:hypothetical protein